MEYFEAFITRIGKHYRWVGKHTENAVVIHAFSGNQTGTLEEHEFSSVN